MGWNCAVAVLTGVELADLGRLGVVPTGRVVTGDEALAEERPCAVLRDGRLVVVSADPRVLDAADEAALALGAALAGVALGSTADVYVLRFRDGARARERVLYGGETVSADGEAWPEEDALETEEFAEDGALAVLERATGLRLDAEWMQLELQELAWTLPGDEPGDEPGDGPGDEPGEADRAAGSDLDAADHPEGAGLDALLATEPVDDPSAGPAGGTPGGPGSRYVDLAPVAASGKLVAGALGLGLGIEALLGLLVLTTDRTFGALVPHLLFAAVAGFVLMLGRLNLVALLLAGLATVVVLLTLLGAANRDEAPAALLLGYGACLVALLGVLGRHARRVYDAQHAMRTAAEH